jgi:hypothetical protein
MLTEKLTLLVSGIWDAAIVSDHGFAGNFDFGFG